MITAEELRKSLLPDGETYKSLVREDISSIYNTIIRETKNNTNITSINWYMPVKKEVREFFEDLGYTVTLYTGPYGENYHRTNISWKEKEK